MTAPAKRRPISRADTHDGPVALAAAILEGSADLRGAACTAHPRLYDPDVRAAGLGYASEAERWDEVQATCISCPARGRCWAWAAELSATRKPAGPLAATMSNPFPVGHAQRRRHRPDDDAELERAEPTEASEPTEPEDQEHTEPATCEGIDCDRPVIARDLCLAHYRRYRRDPDQPRDWLIRPLRRSPGTARRSPRTAATEPPDPEPPPPRPRGARRRVKPSRNRKRHNRSDRR